MAHNPFLSTDYVSQLRYNQGIFRVRFSFACYVSSVVFVNAWLDRARTRRDVIESEFVSVEALIDKQDSSRLWIDIRLHAPNPLGERHDCPHVSLRQAIREGFREAVEEAERKRPKPVARKSLGSWLGRIFG
jgi:hypothetical protein